MAVSVIPTLDLERAIAEQGYDVIVGFDEVGRGSLAGPVMVGAAAIWARDLYGAAGASQGGSQESSPLEVPKGVADSKMLTEHKREAIFDELEQWCAAWAVGTASNTEIDEWGISYALGVAALRALAEAERKLGIGGGESAGIAGSSESSEALNNLKIGAILDGPNDYITKALNTFDAPDVPIPADVTCKVKGDRRDRGDGGRHRQSHTRPTHGQTRRAAAICALRMGQQQRLWIGGTPRSHRRTRTQRPASPVLAPRLTYGISSAVRNYANPCG